MHRQKVRGKVGGRKQRPGLGMSTCVWLYAMPCLCIPCSTFLAAYMGDGCRLPGRQQRRRAWPRGVAVAGSLPVWLCAALPDLLYGSRCAGCIDGCDEKGKFV